MKNKRKTSLYEKGITLVALVVTIIVLLILAGITIRLVLGQNGLIKRATQAHETSTVAEKKEELDMAYGTAQMDKLSKGENAKVSAIELNMALAEEKIACSVQESGNEGEFLVTFDEDNTCFTYNSNNSSITETEKMKTNWWDDYTYQLDDENNKIVLTRYNGESSNAFIGSMAQIGGKQYSTVIAKTEIDENENSIFKGTNATRINIQNGITEIGNGAFTNCSNIVSVSIPSSVKTIKAEAFNKCNNLKTLYIPEGTETIETGAIHNGLSSLESVYIPTTVTSLGTNFFKDLDSLKTAVIGAREISVGSFSSATALQKLTFLEGVEIISNSAFTPMTSLKELKLPSTIKRIENAAFGSCTSLEKLEIPKADFVGNGAFSSCSSLKELTIGAKEISYGMFSYLSNLDKVTLLEGVEKIYSSFVKTNIKQIVLPNSIKEITYASFSDCNQLTDITIPNGIQILSKNAFKISGDEYLKTNLHTTSPVALNYDWNSAKRIINNS